MSGARSASVWDGCFDLFALWIFGKIQVDEKITSTFRVRGKNQTKAILDLIFGRTFFPSSFFCSSFDSYKYLIALGKQGRFSEHFCCGSHSSAAKIILLNKCKCIRATIPPLFTVNYLTFNFQETNYVIVLCSCYFNVVLYMHVYVL